MNYMKTIFVVVFTISIIFNVFSLIEKTSEPNYQLGILMQDIKVTDFSQQNDLFTLPKGLVIRNASPRGIASAGLFSPNRFTFTIIEPESGSIEYNFDRTTSSPKALYFSRSKKTISSDTNYGPPIATAVVGE